MATYAIGDIQGCYRELLQLLDAVSFNFDHDHLWVCGDMVNRGPQSLETLRFLYQRRDNIHAVLGNHDLHLLAIANGQREAKRSDTAADILQASDADLLLEWLQHRPLCVTDSELGYAMVHAGIAPQWSIDDALRLSNEVETVLQGGHFAEFLGAMYGDQPDQWSENLQGLERLRFITNAFTRMRICDAEGRLELNFKGELEKIPDGYIPWYKHPERKTREHHIVFGHWAALDRKLTAANPYNVFGLDTGCVWGQSLSMMRLEDQRLFSVAAEKR